MSIAMDALSWSSANSATKAFQDRERSSKEALSSVRVDRSFMTGQFAGGAPRVHACTLRWSIKCDILCDKHRSRTYGIQADNASPEVGRG